jgi:hypothetical protein
MIQLKTLFVITAATVVIGVGYSLLPTITHKQAKNSSHYPLATTHTQATIPIMTGNTPTYPNVTPQTASGYTQGSDVNPQVTATTFNQFDKGKMVLLLPVIPGMTPNYPQISPQLSTPIAHANYIQ